MSKPEFLQNNVNVIELQEKLTEYELRHQLIANLLSATNTNEGVTKFRRILYDNYLTFANREGALAEEASAMITLQTVLQELEKIGVYPNFYKKRMITVAGGFSTGKSEFISSLFNNNDVRLPIGIQPTTAIPTYAMSSETKEEVLGYSIQGGVVDLLAIDPNLHSKLSHKFIQSFDFNLKNIMPYIFLSTPMYYKSLCFIDTPGYDPSNTQGGYADEDTDTAYNFINNAEAVLWLIGADANGTIPQSDIEFLEQFVDEEKPLYIILNKADLKPQQDIEDILSIIYEELKDSDIAIKGISAYSSTHQKELAYKKQSLFDFLVTLDHESDKHQTIKNKIDEVEKMYRDAIKEEIKFNTSIASKLNSLELDLFEESMDSSKISDRINSIKAIFKGKKNTELSSQLEELEKIMNDFRNAIDQVFGKFPDSNNESSRPLEELKKIMKGFSNATNQVIGKSPHYDDNHQIAIDSIKIGDYTKKWWEFCKDKIRYL